MTLQLKKVETQFKLKYPSITFKDFTIQENLTKFGIEAIINNSATLLELKVVGTATIQDAIEGEISFFANGAYKKYLSQTNASCCIVSQEFADLLPKSCIVLVAKNPYFSFSKLVNYLYGDEEEYLNNHFTDGQQNYNQTKDGGFVHKTAIISPSAIIENGSIVHAFCTISHDVKISPNCTIMQNTFIGKQVVIAKNTYIYNNVSIFNANIGQGCIIRSGAVIGNLGFGFAADAKFGVIKNQHIAGVKIGNFVDIGCNTTIDRGYLTDTIIGDFTKIDNLVMIAHGVKIGSGCFLAGQTGIGGSSELENYVVCGAQSGIAGHLKIVSKTTLAGKSGIISNIDESGVYAGFPAVGIWSWRRMNAV